MSDSLAYRNDMRGDEVLDKRVSIMSASPFRTTIKPYLGMAVPASPTPGELAEAKLSQFKPLEDLSFGASVEEFPVPDDREGSQEKSKSWFARLFSKRTARTRREEVLAHELQDLRASYAGLLHATEEIRERIDLEKEDRQTVQKALSPFPAAVAGIEDIQTRQEEAGEILLNIRERMKTTAERDEAFMTSLGFINDGVGDLKSGVGKVNEAMDEVALNQGALVENLGNLGSEITSQIEEVKTVAEESGERMEQSTDDVLDVLKKMESNHQRGLWIFASLLGALFIVLVCFAAKLSSMAVAGEESAPVLLSSEAADNAVASDSEALVLQDDLEF